MLTNKKIFHNEMDYLKASDYPGRGFKGSKASVITSGDKLSEAIENADGVPFQLIFGQEPGEGYYVNVGGGFRQLLGIESGDLTEELFIGMIEEVVPLNENISKTLHPPGKNSLTGKLTSTGLRS
ncbi:MAG: hypothetical protein IPH69_06230 [Bacteroidales bacterium]|nr:hypothetical protein [Bacteroidales bacterium]